MRVLSVTAAIVAVLGACGARTGMPDDGDTGTCNQGSFAQRGCFAIPPMLCEAGEYGIDCLGIQNRPPTQCRFMGQGSGDVSSAAFCCPCE
jgi:hypothetical protein